MSSDPIIVIPLTLADKEAKKNAMIAYLLIAAGYFTGLFFIAGGIWAILKRDEARNTLFSDHFDNIISTFWIALGLSVLGVLTVWFFVGGVILFFTFVYVVWKVIKGLASLTSDRPYNS